MGVDVSALFGFLYLTLKKKKKEKKKKKLSSRLLVYLHYIVIQTGGVGKLTLKVDIFQEVNIEQFLI